MAEAQKVVFANNEITVHILLDPTPKDDLFGNKLYETESAVLLPGQFIEQSMLPPYLLDAVKKGSVPRLELMPRKRAEDIKAQADAIRSMGDSTVNVQGPASESDAAAEAIAAAKVSTPAETEE